MTRRNLLKAVFGILLPPLVMLICMRALGAYFDEVIVPGAGSSISDWLDSFSIGSWIAAMTLAVLSLVWHAFALLSSSRSGDLRWLWLMLWMIAAVSCTGEFAYCLPAAEHGEGLVLLFSLIAAAVAFYAGTVWSAPSTHKYAPVGFLWIRSVVTR